MNVGGQAAVAFGGRGSVMVSGALEWSVTHILPSSATIVFQFQFSYAGGLRGDANWQEAQAAALTFSHFDERTDCHSGGIWIGLWR